VSLVGGDLGYPCLTELLPQDAPEDSKAPEPSN
jgi:hypothetical protein